MTEPTFPKSVSRHKELIAFGIAAAIGWGTLQTQVSFGKDKDIAQDKAIETNRQKQEDLRVKNAQMERDQQHFTETVEEIKAGQEKIFDAINKLQMSVGRQ